VGYLMAAAAEVPAAATACFNLGQAWIKLGQPRPAAAAYARAAQLDPHDPEAEADLGVALARLGDLRGAIEHERAALRIDPGFEQAGRNLKVLEKVEAARRR
jgi:Flp pilus assembly protein TadD